MSFRSFGPPLVVVTALGLGACSGGTGMQDVPSIVDASDTGPTCPPHTHTTSDGSCDATLTFAAARSIPLARDHHGTALVESPAGPRLVVVGGAVVPDGGTTQVTSNDVAIASIESDGSIGTWSNAPMLPGARAGMAIGVVGDVVVAVGGRNDVGFLPSTVSARIQSDGTLGTWRTGPAINAGRFHLAGATNGRWMYVSGGLAALTGGTTEARPEVWGTQVADDGTIAPWQVLTPLPEGVSHHVSFVARGYLFVAGGLGGDPFNSNDEPRMNVYRTRIAEDGTLGNWESVNQLPDWVAANAGAVNGDRVYLFGGILDETDTTDRIYRASIGADGTLGAWELNPTSLPEARGHLHYAPIREGRVYLVSGSMDLHMPTDSCFVGTFE